MGIFALNAWRDPFADFLFLTGWNAKPIQRIDNYCDIKFKVGLLKSLPPDSIDIAVFGSSRPFRINPDSPGLKEMGNRSYNLAIQGATLPTIKAMIAFAKKKNPSIICVVGLDFFAFAKNDNMPSFYLDPNKSMRAYLDAFKRLFDFKTLIESMRPWNSNARHTLLLNGRSVINLSSEERNKIPDYLEKYSNKTDSINQESSFVYDKQVIIEIIKLKENNANVIFFLNPDSKWYLKRLMNSVLWEDYLRWKNDLRNVGDVIDFSDYHEITNNSDMYFDEVHYLDNAGEVIMKDVANVYFNRPLNFGKKLKTSE